MNQRGSVILYMLMIVAVIAFYVQAIVQGTFIERIFTKTMVAREQAEQLALGGIDLMVAKLTMEPRKEKDDDKDKPAAPADKAAKKTKAMLQRVWPYLNRWQTTKFTHKADGFDGELTLCLTCEEGKLNINEIFDFSKGDFKPPYNTYFKGLVIPNVLKEGELYERFVAFFKKRNKKLNDISELVAIKELKPMGLFYQPPVMPAKEKAPSQANTHIVLTDLFTIWTKDANVNPLWLSDSMCGILGIRRPHANDPMTHEEAFKKFAGEVKASMAQDWEANWGMLEPFYGQKNKTITDYKNIFSKQFEATIYSVVSCGKVENVERTVLAIIELLPQQQQAQQQQPQQQQQQDADMPVKKKYKVLRMYWR